MFFLHVNIDLGSANIRLSIDGKIVVDEPSLVVLDCNSSHVKAIGRKALELADKPLSAISAVYPIKRGRICDFSLAEALLRFYVRQLAGMRRIKACAVLSASADSVDEVCWRQLLNCVGAVSCEFIPAPLSAVRGLGLDTKEPKGQMIVDIGAGKTEVSVLCGEEIITSSSASIGGNDFSSEISGVLRRHYTISVPSSVVESVKNGLASAVPLEVPKEMKVNGFDFVSGMPCERSISSSVISSCLSGPLRDITRIIQDVMLETPCELSADLVDSGIILIGGGSKLGGLSAFLEKHFSIPVRLADTPQYCSISGCNLLLTPSSQISQS
ncbi:MAG: rod shape-determining protein [Candidatus Bruticola sp.]